MAEACQQLFSPRSRPNRRAKHFMSFKDANVDWHFIQNAQVIPLERKFASSSPGLMRSEQWPESTLLHDGNQSS